MCVPVRFTFSKEFCYISLTKTPSIFSTCQLTVYDQAFSTRPQVRSDHSGLSSMRILLEDGQGDMSLTPALAGRSRQISLSSRSIELVPGQPELHSETLSPKIFC